MEESEKRWRSTVARRQQHSVSTSNLPTQNKISHNRPKRKMNEFMLGVAAGLSGRKNIMNAVGMGQSTVSSSVVLPKHYDFSFRDRSDVTAKRRFQVKVPCRLIATFTIIFLVVPGLIFVHKQLHIHEDKYHSHFKTEKYVNVDTAAVWDNFRIVTTNDETETYGVGRNGTVSQQQIEIEGKNPTIALIADLHNQTENHFVAGANQTNQQTTSINNNEVEKDFIETGGVEGFNNSANAAKDSLSTGMIPETFDQEKHSELNLMLDSSQSQSANIPANRYDDKIDTSNEYGRGAGEASEGIQRNSTT